MKNITESAPNAAVLIKKRQLGSSTSGITMPMTEGTGIRSIHIPIMSRGRILMRHRRPALMEHQAILLVPFMYGRQRKKGKAAEEVRFF